MIFDKYISIDILCHAPERLVDIMEHYTRAIVCHTDNGEYIIRTYVIDESNKTTYGPIVSINTDEMIGENGAVILPLNN